MRSRIVISAVGEFALDALGSRAVLIRELSIGGIHDNASRSRRKEVSVVTFKAIVGSARVCGEIACQVWFAVGHSTDWSGLPRRSLAASSALTSCSLAALGGSGDRY